MKLYSTDFSVRVIGQSVNKKDIELYKFGNGKNIIVLIAGLHGDEINYSESLLTLIRSIKNDEIKISEDSQLWIIPVANPDGIEKKKRLNENNADLNANFYTDNWQPTFFYHSKLISAGEFPFSEPETNSLKNFFESIEDKSNIIVLNLRSSGNFIIPGNNSEPCMNFCDYLYRHSFLFYFYQNPDLVVKKIGIFNSGDICDWLSNKLNVISATLALENGENIFEDMKKLLVTLQKTDIKEQFYKYSFEVPYNNNGDDLKYLMKNLPENVSRNIYSNGNIEEFKKLYFSILDEEELLMLVNKKNYLPPDYEPKDLVEVNSIFKSNKKSIKLRKILIQDMEEMFANAKKENVNLIIISAYRSYATQEYLFNYWKKELGEKEAKRVSALPGASQHQLGTAIDFNALDENFGETKEGKWLDYNAYKYGFVISYPYGLENFTGYKYEPWHYRYIGKDASLLVYKYFNNNLELFLSWYWNSRNL